MLIGAEQTETVMTASGSDDSAFIGVRINIRRTGNLIAELSEQTVAAAEKFTDKVFAAVAPFLDAGHQRRKPPAVISPHRAPGFHIHFHTQLLGGKAQFLNKGSVLLKTSVIIQCIVAAQIPADAVHAQFVHQQEIIMQNAAAGRRIKIKVIVAAGTVHKTPAVVSVRPIIIRAVQQFK